MEGVVEPMMNGIGGDLMAVVYDSSQPKARPRTLSFLSPSLSPPSFFQTPPSKHAISAQQDLRLTVIFQPPQGKRLIGINSSGRAPKATTRQQMAARIQAAGGQPGDPIPTKGPLPVSVPGAVAGWCELHSRFGTVRWADLFTAPIRYAREGFPVSPVIASEWELTPNSSDVTSNGRFPNAADGFYRTFTVPDATTGVPRAPRAGEWFANPDLADTLAEIARGGCEAFYTGSIAEKIAAFAQEAGTLLTAEDMRTHRSEWVTPVSTTYR